MCICASSSSSQNRKAAIGGAALSSKAYELHHTHIVGNGRNLTAADAEQQREPHVAVPLLFLRHEHDERNGLVQVAQDQRAPRLTRPNQLVQAAQDLQHFQKPDQLLHVLGLEHGSARFEAREHASVASLQELCCRGLHRLLQEGLLQVCDRKPTHVAAAIRLKPQNLLWNSQLVLPMKR